MKFFANKRDMTYQLVQDVVRLAEQRLNRRALQLEEAKKETHEITPREKLELAVRTLVEEKVRLLHEAAARQSQDGIDDLVVAVVHTLTNSEAQADELRESLCTLGLANVVAWLSEKYLKPNESHETTQRCLQASN